MRNRCRGKYSPAVASVIVRNYSRLMERLCASQSGPVQGAMDDADIMQETFLHVTHLARFVFRYRLVRFQTLRDEAQRKTIPYADYLRMVERDEDR